MRNISQITVRKMDGTLESYNPQKLQDSLRNAGADDETINQIIKKTGSILHPGIETKELFNFVFKELRKTNIEAGYKYNLKNAILDLTLNGGFAFEKFVARILEKQGYTTRLNAIVRGKIITHEIDVISRKGREVLMVEAKHHIDPWHAQSIQTALYVYARFLDVKETNGFTKPMLATNTKFSDQTMQYAKGVGMRLMGWKYPKGDNIESNIEKYKLYPITILPGLKKPLKETFLAQGILTLQDLVSSRSVPKILKDQAQILLVKKEEKEMVVAQ
ncbi:MAG: restriction endonuclease [Nanoarchaeota archaeon]|nr:restriction endonuclease [Nanoarchaeota archaeon]